ncbi:Tll0287-like domain-containing protein [Marinoscillum pacificum]|uniref:Tll0287-like domain-containing protein n=1 Tax=Marinoscillum pacificum TaxID=392723 RepID=UPI002157C5C1|nr:DUF3365 domain-containing protein [Marinoscillum pacificum]
MRPKNILIPTLICAFFLCLIGCKPDKPVDREAVKKELEAREFKRVTEGEIMAKGEEIAKSALKVTAQTFQSALMTAIQEEGVPGAIEYCNTNAMEIVKKLEDSLNISIKRVTNKTRNPADSLTGIEKEIWEAYNYDPSQATAQLQEFSDTELIFTQPIMIGSGVCLNCHGGVGAELTNENYEFIKTLYPNDQATGYQLGDLRGMWRLIIPKKTVVNAL